jgi:YVTN family beta-propeller protein
MFHATFQVVKSNTIFEDTQTMKSQTYRFFIFSYVLMFIPTAAVNKVIATIGVGDTPARIAITSDNLLGYVANNNNDGIPNADSVTVLNLKTNTVVTTIHDSSFNEPYTITLNAANTKAYVTNSAGSTITIVAIPSNTVLGTISGFDGPSGMAITPGGTTAYVNNYGGPVLGSGNGHTISIVNLNTNQITGTISVGLAPAALAMSPDGQFLYSINYVDGNPGTGTMNVIRTSDNTVINTIPGFSGPFAIAITPKGKYAYVTNFGSNNFFPYGTTVSVVNLSSNTIVDTIQLGVQPSGIAITPNGKLAYATNYDTLYLGANFTDLTAGQGTVQIIDTCTNKVICSKILVGPSPASISISPDGTRAYTTNYSGNSVSVINICDNMWLNVCS